MKIKNYLLGAAVAGSVMLSNTALAVDGYKGLKFGMSTQEVLDQRLCSFESDGIDENGIEAFYCDDFNFGSEITDAAAYFINGKFLRFGILGSMDRAEGLMNGLTAKYGSPSSMSTQEEFQAVDSLPDRSAYIAFDQETVVLKVESDVNFNQSVLLIYTDTDFDKMLLDSQANAMSSDL